jgi:uncharacterized protein
VSEILMKLTEIRATRPEAVAAALATRKRRQLLGEGGTLFLLAADHPARGIVKAGENPRAMADRGDFLARIVTALQRPGVDGLMASPDVVDDLALLGALEEKVVIGSMNRGGLAGAAFELDDRFTGYTAEAIARANLDGGKMLLRIADNDRDTLPTITACAEAVDSLAARGLMAMIEPFASRRSNGRVENILEPDPTIRAIGISSALGSTSAYTWLKLPVVPEMERVMAATTLPTLLLGGDPGADAQKTFEGWRRAMEIPQVRGLVAGRTLLYPPDGDVGAAVDAAAAIVSGEVKPVRETEVR